MDADTHANLDVTADYRKLHHRYIEYIQKYNKTLRQRRYNSSGKEGGSFFTGIPRERSREIPFDPNEKTGPLSPIVEMNKLCMSIDDEQESANDRYIKIQKQEEVNRRTRTELNVLRESISCAKDLTKKIRAEIDKYSFVLSMIQQDKGSTSPPFNVDRARYQRAAAIAKCIKDDNNFTELLYPTNHSNLMYRVYVGGNDMCMGSIQALDPGLILFRNIVDEILKHMSALDIINMFAEFKTNFSKSLSTEASIIRLFKSILTRVIKDSSIVLTDRITKSLDFKRNYEIYIIWLLTMGYIPVERSFVSDKGQYCACKEKESDNLLLGNYKGFLGCINTYTSNAAKKYCHCNNTSFIPSVLYQNNAIVYRTDPDTLKTGKLYNNNNSDCYVSVVQYSTLSQPDTSVCGRLSVAYQNRKHAEELRKQAMVASLRPRVVICRVPLPHKDKSSDKYNPENEKLRRTEKALTDKNDAQAEAIKELTLRNKEAERRQQNTSELMKVLTGALDTEVNLGHGALRNLAPIIVSAVDGDMSAFHEKIRGLNIQMQENGALSSSSKQYLKTTSATGFVPPEITQRCYTGHLASGLSNGSHLEASNKRYDARERELIHEEIANTGIMTDVITQYSDHVKINSMKSGEVAKAKKDAKDWRQRIECLIHLVEQANATIAIQNRYISMNSQALCDRDSQIETYERSQRDSNNLLKGYENFIETNLIENLPDKEGGGNKNNNTKKVSFDKLLKKAKDDFNNELKTLIKIKEELDNIISRVNQDGIYENTDVFDIQPRELQELPSHDLVETPLVVNVAHAQGECDTVFASKLAIEVPDLKQETDYEAAKWLSVVVDRFKFLQCTTYSNTLIKLIPRSETNQILMTPFFDIMCPYVKINMESIDENSNPLAMDRDSIVDLLLDKSNIGQALSAVSDSSIPPLQEDVRVTKRAQLQQPPSERDNVDKINSHG